MNNAFVVSNRFQYLLRREWARAGISEQPMSERIDGPHKKTENKPKKIPCSCGHKKKKTLEYSHYSSTFLLRNMLKNTHADLDSKEILRSIFESPPKTALFWTLIGSALISGLTVFGISIPISITLVSALFLFHAEFFFPGIFLLILVTARMGTDFLADQFSLKLGKSFSLPLSQMLGILLVVYGIIFFSVNFRRRKFFHGPAVSLFLVLFLWGVFSPFYSPIDNESSLVLRECLRLFGIFFLFVFSYHTIRNKTLLQGIFVTFFVSSILPVLLGIYQFIFGIGYTDEAFSVPRIFGTFSHPNVFSLYLFCLIVLAFAYRRIFTQSPAERYVMSGLIALYGILLVLTYTRVSLFITLFFFILLAFFQNKKLLIPLLIFPLVVFLFIPSIQERFSDIIELRSSSSLAWRFALWNDAIQSVLSQGRTFFGYGMGSFSSVVEGMRGNKLGSTDPHSDPIRFFVEGGLVGIGIYVFMIATLFRNIRVAWKSGADDPLLKEMFPIVFSFFAALTLAGFTDHIYSNTVIQWILWIILGATFSLARENENAPSITEEASV